MFSVNLVPGQGFRRLAVWRKRAGMHSSGRPLACGYADTGLRLYALVNDARQQEVQQWAQAGHPVTHALIQMGAGGPAQETDYLVSPDGRYFYIQGRGDPGNLGAALLYYAEERGGIDGQYTQPGGSGNPGGGEGDTGPAAGEGGPGGQ